MLIRRAAQAVASNMTDQQKKRPNIVYMMFDQCRASAAPRNPYTHLPFLEEIVATGIEFTGAYATSPVCNPSRAAVHTGVHPLVNQVTCNQNWAPHNLPQLAELLAGAGYTTMAAGHFDGHQNLARGWHMQVRSGDVGRLRRSYETWVRSFTDPVAWRSGRREGTAEDGHAYVLASRMMEMIDTAVADGAPFFAHLCFEDPHNPYTAPAPYDTIVDPDVVALPAIGDGPLKPAWQYELWEQGRSADASDADIRRMIATYHGMVAYADAQMARVVEHLERHGVLDETWIIVGSDHGDYLGEKGIYAKTESLYECLLHVPLVIRPPGGMAGRQVEGLVDMVDLFPTILAIGGVEVPDYAQGSDLVSWVHEGGPPLREAVFSQVGDYHGSLGTTYPAGMPAAGRHPGLLEAVRTTDFSYIRDPDYGDEAYNLGTDPQELLNLLQDGNGVDPAVKELSRRVDQWHEECFRLRDSLGVVQGLRGFDYE